VLDSTIDTGHDLGSPHHRRRGGLVGMDRGGVRQLRRVWRGACRRRAPRTLPDCIWRSGWRRALAGPTLCRPCTQPFARSATAWRFAVPPLVALGIAVAVSRRQATLAVMPTCAGLALFAEYTVTISYAAPRFLLPAYALASIPAAQGLLWGAGFVARWWVAHALADRSGRDACRSARQPGSDA
jgi:hypothetical protein